MNETVDQNEIQLLMRELESIRERYLRLADLHGKLQIQNSVLEERVLNLVENSTNEKQQLERALSNAQQKIHYLQDTIQELQIDKQRYKDDCHLAVRLLHCYPNDFRAANSAQVEEQLKTRYEMSANNSSNVMERSILIPTFPPTFLAPPSLFVPNPTSSTTTDLRLVTKTLFKSNSIDRYPLNRSLCPNCHQSIRPFDGNVQTQPEENNDSQRGTRSGHLSAESFDDRA